MLVYFLVLLIFLYEFFGWIMERFIHYPIQMTNDMFQSLYASASSRTQILYTSNKYAVPVIIIKPKNTIPIENKKCIIFSHGNSGNVSTTFAYLKKIADVLNVCVISYDYVGYGISNNTYPSEQLCYESHECVINYAIDCLKYDPKNIYLMGRSLGTGIVIDYVHKYNWKTPVILVSPYTSILSIAIGLYFTYTWFKFLIFFDKFKSFQKLNSISCPIKIYHGIDDTVIDIKHGKYIFGWMINQTLKPTWLKGAEHNDIFGKIDMNSLKEIIML